MIEPAACGIPICFGPNTENFLDVVEQLLAAQAAQVVDSSGRMQAFVRGILEDSQAAEAMGERGRQVVRTQIGATRRTVDVLSASMSVLERLRTGSGSSLEAA